MNEDLRGTLDPISGAGEEELERIGRAIEERQRELALSAGEGIYSQVVEARPYKDGWLQLEWRPYERKDGGVVRRGPYWYFRYHEGGKQRKLYVGKTDDPEGALARKRK